MSGRGPVQGAARSQSRGSKREAEVGGEGADQRGVGGGVAAGEAGEGGEEVGLQAAGRGGAEDVQAVADLALLEVAEEGVELAQAAVAVVAGGEAGVAARPVAWERVEDFAAEVVEAAGVHSGGGVVFVDQGSRGRGAAP